MPVGMFAMRCGLGIFGDREPAAKPEPDSLVSNDATTYLMLKELYRDDMMFYASKALSKAAFR